METLTRDGLGFAFEGPDPVFSWFRGIWEDGSWEPETLQVVERFVKPGTTLVDIGAWLGPVSLWATHLGGRAVAVEPDPVAVEYLRRIVDANEADIEVF